MIKGIPLHIIGEIYSKARKSRFEIVKKGFGQIEYFPRGFPFRVIDNGRLYPIVPKAMSEEEAKFYREFPDIKRTVMMVDPGVRFEFEGANWIAEFHERRVEWTEPPPPPPPKPPKGLLSRFSVPRSPALVRSKPAYDWLDFAGDPHEAFDDLMLARLCV